MRMSKIKQLDYKEILSRIKENYDLCKTHYASEHKKMKVLDATDKGDMWKALNIKFPPYQILPDTNFISYVKSNILASIYTVVKGASLQPTSDEDKEIVNNLNIAIEAIWDLCDIGYYQFQAGERAALLNMGITQIGWDDTLTAGSGSHYYKGNVTVKNISPIKFMRDPFAIDLDTAGYCMTYDVYHKSVFLENPNYKEAFKEYEAKMKHSTPLEIPEMRDAKTKGNAKDYYTLVTYFEKVGTKVNEYHTINCEHMLYAKEDIRPSVFPFAILYCNEPAESLVGTSECSKIYANNVAYNLLDSIAITAEYKNQRPPKFINRESGLNVQSFSKHGDEADKTFIVNGNAQNAVHYHQFPQISPVLTNLKMSLENNMETVSGVDGRYRGRDTGSVMTTGGIEQMLNQVTMIDAPKIALYERYTKQLTQIIMSNFFEFAPKRKYLRKDAKTNKWVDYEIDFPKISPESFFNYVLHISSELPKNKQRIAATANLLMEKQMQYQQQGSAVQLITEEEWLEMQDLPFKERMQERMGVQRLQDAQEEVAQTLFGYADLIQQGASPDDAMLAMAQALKDKRAGNMENPAIPGMIPEEQAIPPQM